MLIQRFFVILYWVILMESLTFDYEMKIWNLLSKMHNTRKSESLSDIQIYQTWMQSKLTCRKCHSVTLLCHRIMPDFKIVSEKKAPLRTWNAIAHAITKRQKKKKTKEKCSLALSRIIYCSALSLRITSGINHFRLDELAACGWEI